MKLFNLLLAITFSVTSLYFALNKEIELATLFMCYAIYSKLDTKD